VGVTGITREQRRWREEGRGQSPICIEGKQRGGGKGVWGAPKELQFMWTYIK